MNAVFFSNLFLASEMNNNTWQLFNFNIISIQQSRQEIKINLDHSEVGNWINKIRFKSTNIQINAIIKN